MKRPQPDIGQLVLGNYLNKLAFVRKFVKYWGTTHIDGVEVMREKRYYYKTWRQDENFKKLAKHLGIWEDVRNPQMEGVKRAWFYLNKDKQDIASLTDDLVASNFNKALADYSKVPDEYKMTAVLTIGGKYNRPWSSSRSNYTRVPYIRPTLDTPLTDQEGAKTELLSKYKDWFNYFLMDTSYVKTKAVFLSDSGKIEDIDVIEDVDPYKDALVNYILFSTDVPFEIKEIRNGKVESYYTYNYTYEDEDSGMIRKGTRRGTVLKPGYEVEIEIPLYNFSTTTDIVVKLTEDITAKSNVSLRDRYSYINSQGLNKSRIIQGLAGIRQYQTEASDSYLGGNTDEVITKYAPSSNSIYSDLWMVSSSSTLWGGVNYVLKAEALTSNLLSLDERIKLINDVLDTGYKKKSSSKWGGILAFVVFIVVIYFTWDYNAAGAAASIVSLATAVTVAALVVALVTLALSEMGYENTAAAMAKFSAQIEPLVKIAGIITLIAGIAKIASAIQESAKQAAMQAAAQQVAKEVGRQAIEMTKDEFAKLVMEKAADIMKEQFMSMVWAGVKDQFSNLIVSKTTDLSLDNAVKLVNMAFDMYQKNQMSQLKDDIAQARTDLERYTKEQNETNHVLLAANLTTFKQLKADWSIYADVYDRPYEWWSTPYHTGCIQANTVDGMWLADRKNGIMDKNIL